MYGCYCLLNDTATTDIYTYVHPLSLHTARPIDLLSIRFGMTDVARHGLAVEGYGEAPVAAQLNGSEIEIGVDIGLGDGRATVWTCDLTHGYISINADYRS